MPSWIKGHLRRGVALFELARYQEAYNAFKQGLNFEPNNEELKKKMSEAESKWKGNLNPAQLRKEEGNAFLKEGKMQDAVKSYTEALKLCKDDDTATKAQCYNNRAHCYVQLYEPTKVIEDCSACLNIEPFNVKALLRRGFAYEQLEKMQSAMSDFNQVILVDPSNKKANQALVRVRNGLQNKNK